MTSDPQRAAGEPSTGSAPANAPSPEPTPDPTLERAWAALEASGASWAMLRGTGTGGEEEVDVLVAPGDHVAVERALAGAGYARLATVGHGRHRFFRTFDPDADQWRTIDTLDSLGFGPDAALRLGLPAEAALRDRDASRRPARLDADTGFWLLLLHDLIDRRETPAQHLAQRVELRAGARTEGPAGAALDAAAGQGTSRRLLELVDRGDEAALRRAGRGAAAAWRRRDPGGWAAGRAAGWLARRTRKVHTLIRRRGIDVAILGPDGAGKSSAAAALTESPLLPTRTIYLGLYSAGLAGGRFAFARRLGRLWGGWLRGLWHRARGRVVVYDRHALEASLQTGGTSWKRRIRRWVLGHAIPGPALLVVLDAPGDVLHARSGEHDPETLERQRAAFRALAARRPGSLVLDATVARDDIRRALTAAVWRRWTGVDG